MNKEQLIKNISLNSQCPICNNTDLEIIDKIKSNIDEFHDIFDLVLCKKCSHRFISKFPNENYLNELYKNNSHYVIGQYKEKKLRKQEFINDGFSKVIADRNHWVLKFVELKNKGNYFEVGPGLCNLYKVFVEENWNCEALELQEWINGPGIVHNFEEIQKDKKDLIVMLDVLEHTIDPVLFIKKLSNFHNKDGLLFLTFPNGESFKSKILGSKWPMVYPLSHLHFFSKKSIKIALEKNGYKDIVLKPFSFVKLYRLLRNIPKLIFKCLLDLLTLKFKSFTNRIFEFILNILDLLNGDQMKVVAKKIQ